MSTKSCCSTDCCAETSVGTAGPAPDAEKVREAVRKGYGAIARTGTSCCGGEGVGGGGCCGGTPADLADALGYSVAELANVPGSANMGLSCGNPTALATLRPGEVVLDLGAGGGFDCFIAGPKVGPLGRVIGVDMTADMVTKARGNLAQYRARTGLDNVEFRLGEIEALPVADASVDVVISNCVVNLSPDKPRVWREISRVLKPGGRVAISDLHLLRPLPPDLRADLEALIGCIAGAVVVEETGRMAMDAGLVEIELTPKPAYVDAMASSGDPLFQRLTDRLGGPVGDFVTSLDVRARKQSK